MALSLLSRPYRVALLLGGALTTGGWVVKRTQGLHTAVNLRVGDALERLPSGAELPFRLRLEAMAVDAAPAGPKVLLREGDREQVLDPREGASLQMGKVAMTVEKMLPSAMPDFRFRETDKGPEYPVLHMMLGLGTPVPLEGYLVAREDGRRRFDEPAGRFSVLFVERWDDALLASLRPRPGKLLFSIAGKTLEHPATPGVWSFPSFDLHIQDVIPDMGFEEGKDGHPKVFHRTRTPRNPWVLLSLTQSGGGTADLLVAAEPPQNPSYRAALSAALPPGADLRYDRSEEELQHRFVVLTPDGEARLIEEGHLVRSELLAPRQPFVVAKGLSVTVLDRFLRAQAVEAYVPAPEGAGLTSAVRVKAGADAEPQWLGEERPWVMTPSSLQLRFGAPTPAADSVRARLIATDLHGQILLQHTLTGPEHLDVEGYDLALGQGASQRGKWVQVRLSRDPGRWPFLIGLVLLGLGALLFIQDRRRVASPL